MALKKTQLVAILNTLKHVNGDDSITEDDVTVEQAEEEILKLAEIVRNKDVPTHTVRDLTVVEKVLLEEDSEATVNFIKTHITVGGDEKTWRLAFPRDVFKDDKHRSKCYKIMGELRRRYRRRGHKAYFQLDHLVIEK